MATLGSPEIQEITSNPSSTTPTRSPHPSSTPIQNPNPTQTPVKETNGIKARINAWRQQFLKLWKIATQPKKEKVDPRRCLGMTRGLSWAVRMNVGERTTMEDYYSTARGLMMMSCVEFGGCTAPHSKRSQKKVPIHYYGVFDGHRGHQVSEHCARKLHDLVIEEWEKQSSGAVVEWREKWKIVFTRAFKRADDIFKQGNDALRFPGSTASVIVISPCQIIASNCGDSKAILCRSEEVIQLTVDHKPYKKEARWIEKLGGRILMGKCSRIEGIFAMRRAIGDQDLNPIVTPEPSATYTQRSREDECLILASDGLWDVMSVEHVAAFAREKFRVHRPKATLDASFVPAASVAEDLIKEAQANDSKDNITIIVVDLKPLRKRKNGSENNGRAPESGLQVS